MQVLYYGKTGFGTNDWICMQLKEVCYFCHSPKFGEVNANREVMLL